MIKWSQLPFLFCLCLIIPFIVIVIIPSHRPLLKTRDHIRWISLLRSCSLFCHSIVVTAVGITTVINTVCVGSSTYILHFHTQYVGNQYFFSPMPCNCDTDPHHLSLNCSIKCRENSITGNYDLCGVIWSVLDFSEGSGSNTTFCVTCPKRERCPKHNTNGSGSHWICYTMLDIHLQNVQNMRLVIVTTWQITIH